VKDSPVLDPSLAKEVKDSSLTILVQFLFSYRYQFYREEEEGHTIEGFLQRGRTTQPREI
jgi:hypothetical protein